MLLSYVILSCYKFILHRQCVMLHLTYGWSHRLITSKVSNVEMKVRIEVIGYFSQQSFFLSGVFAKKKTISSGVINGTF
jgi:hypothetical protein